MNVENKKLPYRLGVGIVLFNEKGHVWTGRRIFNNSIKSSLQQLTLDANKEASNEFLWQLPQGGIDENEDPLLAAKRELFEETGVTSCELLYEIPEWLTYTFPDQICGKIMGGKYCGQKQKWFAFRFLGDDSEVSITGNGNHFAEFDSWCWRPMEEMVEMIVPFKRDLYRKVFDNLQQFAKKL